MAEERQFIMDVEELRRRARQHIEEGAVTSEYKLDREIAVKVLNEALATEIVCVLRYRQNYYTAVGINSDSVRSEFLEHAIDEQRHADMIADRITQLGGNPEMSPQIVAQRSHTEYAEKPTLVEMIQENLVAERIAIASYMEIIRFFGDHDPTSRRLIEEILAKEEEHANDMADLLLQMPHH